MSRVGKLGVKTFFFQRPSCTCLFNPLRSWFCSTDDVLEQATENESMPCQVRVKIERRGAKVNETELDKFSGMNTGNPLFSLLEVLER